MAKRTTKKTTRPVRPQLGDGVEILNAGSVLEDPITSTLETNYMPYAMSAIVSRALPEIDGFKPAHRKLLYTMYGMGLLKGARTKSANIVGSTLIRRRLSGFMVVSHIISGSFSPRPLERWMVYFLSPISFRKAAFSGSV